jgi:predicted DNA-binding transcriptional regulator YafY
MLQALPRAPQRITAADLADRLAGQGHRVSKRSVERDLQSLADAFPIECDDRSKPYGWSWLRNAPAFSLPGMSPLQALVLKTAEVNLKGLLPASQLAELRPLFQQAAHTLGLKAGREGLAAWPKSVVVVPATLAVLPPEINADVLRTIHQALIDRRQVRITYRPRGGDTDSAYSVHPIGLIQRGSVSYLACTVEDHEDARLLAMHRIRKADSLETPAKRQPAEVLESAKSMVTAGFNDRGVIKLVLNVATEAATHIGEGRLSEDQKVSATKDPGWVRIEATVRDTEQLRWWLHAYADNIEVLAPKALRVYVAGVHAVAASRYLPEKHQR